MNDSGKPVLAFDLDDTVANSLEALRLEVNRTYSVDLKPEDYMITADYHDYYYSVWDNHQLNVDFESLSTNMTLDQLHIDPFPGAQKTLEKLAENYDLQIVTSRYASWESATYAWLDNKLPGLFSDVHFTDLQLIDGQIPTKGQLCRQIGAGWLIDDNPAFCLTAEKENIQSVLFGDYGWHTDDYQIKTTCPDWQQIENLFR
jgi:5'(3')-deoxyribonucleotidase